MSDATQHVGPGQPVAIPAAVWNDVLDMVQEFRRRRGTAPGAGPGSGATKRAANQVLVKNGTGSSLGAHAVVAIGTPLTAASADPHDVYEHPVFPGTAPAATTDPFAVLRDPLGATPENLFGWAVVQGPCVAYVSVTDITHKYAVPAAGVTAALASATTGPARILTTVTGTGTQLVEVLLLGDAPGSSGGSASPTNPLVVRVATTAAGALASDFENGDTVDGKVLLTGDAILIKDQPPGDEDENGVYTVNASGAPTRHTDANTGAKVLGLTVAVTEGTANRDTLWLCAADAPVTVGSSPLLWELIGPRGFPVELTSGWSAVTGYDWKRLVQADIGLSDASPAVTGQYARTANGDVALGTGTRGWLEPANAAGGRGWLFIPALGANTLTNASGLPLATGVTGVLPATNGGTGANNGSYTVTLGGSYLSGGAVTFSGAFALTINVTAITNITFPTGGTLLSTTGGGAYWKLWGTVRYTDLTAALTTETILLTAIPAKTAVIAAFVRTVVPADDTGLQLSGVTVSIARQSDPGSGVNLYGPSSLNTADDVTCYYSASGSSHPPLCGWTTTSDIGIDITIGGALDFGDLDAGEWDLWVLLAAVP